MIKPAQFLYDSVQFPPMHNQKSKASPSAVTSNTGVSTDDTKSVMSSKPTISVKQPTVDLKAILEEIKCHLQANLIKLVQQAMQPVQQDLNNSMAKLTLNTTVTHHITSTAKSSSSRSPNNSNKFCHPLLCRGWHCINGHHWSRLRFWLVCCIWYIWWPSEFFLPESPPYPPHLAPSLLIPNHQQPTPWTQLKLPLVQLYPTGLPANDQ